jgi:hypothetical protein
MNMKPMDLQMAIPRATEVGRAQQQMQHKPQQDQTLLQQTNVKDSEQAAQKANEVDKSDQDGIRDQENQEKQNQEGQKRKNAYQKAENKKKPDEAEHPFKGKNIDLSL